MIDLYAGGQRERAHEDNLNTYWWFTELLLAYKFGEKYKYERALAKLRPYMDDLLVSFFDEIHDQSIWYNPITGKKGY